MTSFLTLRAESEKIRGLFNESVDICFVVEPSRTGATDGFLPQWQPGIGIGKAMSNPFPLQDGAPSR